MSRAQDPLANIVYVSLPESTKRKIGGFVVDPTVLLPVEVEGDNPEWSLKNLSWEMILAGILKVLSHEPDHPKADYFRQFAFAVKPDIFEILHTSALVKAKNREFDLAEEFFSILTGLAPDNATTLLNLALLYEQREETYETLARPKLAETYRKKAFSLYRDLTEQGAPPPEAHLRFGSFLLRHGDPAGGLEQLKRYRSADISEGDMKSVEKIIASLESQVVQDGLFRSAYELISTGREKEGIERILSFLETRPEEWNAWFLLGWGYRRVGEYEKAKTAFQRTLSLKPDESDAMNELAICDMELKEYDACQATLEQALKIQPGNVKFLSNLAILHLKRKRPEEAKRLFLAIVEKEPDDPIARKYLEFLE